MSSSNSGLQTILWRYLTPLVGRDLAQMNATILKPGIYSGLVASKASDTSLQISSGEVLIEDSLSSDEPPIVKISFATAFLAEVTYPNRFVVLRYEWHDMLENYADVLNVSTIGDHDILLAAVDFVDDGEGNFIIDSVDAASATPGQNYLVEALYTNLAPSIEWGYSRTLRVAAGQALRNSEVETFAGGTFTFDLSLNNDGRWDVLGLYEGVLTVIKGVEGSTAYPSIVNMVPICLAHIRKGMTSFLGTDLVDIRPFLSYATSGGSTGFVSYEDIVNGFDNAYGTTTPSQLTDFTVTVSGHDANISITPQAKLTNLLCYQYQISPDEGVTWYPSSRAGYDSLQPGAYSYAWSPTIELKNLPHAGSTTEGFSPKKYIVRIRQVTTKNETSIWSAGLSFLTQPITDSDIAAGSITDISISSDSLVAKTVSNYNTRNDRIDTTPATPVISASDGADVDYTDNIDGSVNLSFEWQYDGSGDAYDVDGFTVFVHQSSSPSSYVMGTDPASEQTYFIAPDRQALIMYGAPKDKYYTFGVQAYRIVDTDIDSSGILKSAIAQPSASAEDPFFPQAHSPFAGDIGSTVTSPAALDVLDTTAPDSSVASIDASLTTDGGILVSWSGFVDYGVGIFGYKVWRKGPTDASVFLVQETLSNVLSFTDYVVSVGAAYKYAVAAYDRNGNECVRLDYTDPVTVVGPTVVPIPETFSAVAGSGYVELSFPVISNRDFIFFVVDRSIDGGSSYPDTFHVRSLVFRDYGIEITDQTDIKYKVRLQFATTGLGSSTTEHSIDAGYFTPAAGSAPTSPTVVATAGTDGTIALAWDLCYEAQSYRLFRKVSTLATWYQIAELDISKTSYVDSDIAPGSTYTYAIRAVGSLGVPDTTSFSSKVSAATLCVDIAAPTVPNLNMTPLVGAVRLSWVTDLRAGSVYDVYRCVGSWSDTSALLIERLYAEGSSTLNYTDNLGALVAANFSYKLRTEDPYGNISGFSSNAVQLTQTIIPEFPSDENLILYWPFDDAGLVTEDLVSDLSGHDYYGRIYPSAPSTVWGAGKSGSLLNFDSDIYVDGVTGHLPALTGATAVTYSFWVSTFVSSRIVFQHGAANVDGIKLTTSSDGSLILTLYNSAGIDGAALFYSITLPSGTLLTSLTHYAVIVDNSTRKLSFYKDGLYGSSYDLPGTMQMPGATSKLVIGASTAYASKLIGSLDEFRIYSTVLLPKNIRALQQYVTSGSLGNLVAIGTQKYRSVAAPTYGPVPVSVSHSAAQASGLLRVELSWDTYVQGDIPANFFSIFWKSGLTNPGAPAMTDSSVTIPVSQGSYVFDNIPPDRVFSFAIAAGRHSETGVVFTSLRYTNALGVAVWENVNVAASPDFTGTVAGTEATVVGDVTAPDLDYDLVTVTNNPVASGGHLAGSATVTWAGATDTESGIEGYEVYRSPSADLQAAVLYAVVIDDSRVGTYSWDDIETSQSVAYYYSVRAFDHNKNKTTIPVGGWKSVTAQSTVSLSGAVWGYVRAIEGKIQLHWLPNTDALTNEIYVIDKSTDGKLITDPTKAWTTSYFLAQFPTNTVEDTIAALETSDLANYMYRITTKLPDASRTSAGIASSVDTSLYGGTYVVSVPSVSVTVEHRTAYFTWAAQTNLFDFDKYQMQFQANGDGANWYAVSFTAAGVVKGTLGAWTDLYDNGVVLNNLAIATDSAGLPLAAGQAYKFHVRRVPARGTSYAQVSSDVSFTVLGTTTTDLVASAITSALLAAGAVGMGTLQNRVVSAINIVQSAITNVEIAASTIVSANMGASAINTVNIVQSAITSALVASSAINVQNLVDSAITTSKIAASAITSSLMANSAINTANIVASAITSAQLAASSVNASNIVASAITSAKIAASAITSSLMAASAINTVNLAASAVTSAIIAASSIVGTHITDSAITAPKIVASSITAVQIAASTISAANMAASSIAAINIVSSSITATQIAASSVAAMNMAASSIAAINIVGASITAAQLAASTILASNMAARSIAAVNIVSSSITATQLAAESVNANILAAGALSAPVQGLLAYWSGDDATDMCHDNSGNSVNGTVGSSAPTSIAGVSGNAINFSGAANCYYQFGYTKLTFTGAFTFSCWIQGLSRAAAQNIIFSRGGSTGSYSVRLGLSTTNRPYMLVCEDGTNYITLQAGAGYGYECTEDCHLVFVYVPSSYIAIYKNGIQIAYTATNVPASLYETGSFYKWLGTYTASTYNFTGWVDEARLYSRVLSQAEIKFLYSFPSGHAPGTIIGDQIQASSLNARTIAASAITAVNIVSSSITASLLAANSVNAINITAGAIAAPLLGLMGYWALDDATASSARDNSGNGYTGTVTGPSVVAGVSGNGLSFDGANDTLSVGTVPVYVAMSVSMWVLIRADVATNNPRLYSHGTADYVFWNYNTTTVNFLTYKDASNKCAASCSLTLFNDGNYHHVVVVTDGTVMPGTKKVYIDGTLVADTNQATLGDWTTLITPTAWTFGSAGSASTYMNGNLDEIRYYSRALSLAEVKALYNVPSGYMPGMITGDRIVASSISAINIVASSITATQIGASAVTAANMAASSIAAINIVSSSISAAQMAASSIAAVNIVSSSITASLLAAESVNAINIVAGAISAPIQGLIGYWALDDIPAYPDSAAGTTYFQDAFATADSWSGTQCTIAVANGILSTSSPTGTAARAERSIAIAAGATVRLRVRKNSGTGTLRIATDTDTLLNSSTVTLGVWVVYDFTATNVGTILRVYPSYGQTDGAADVDWCYVGTGAYTSVARDSSGSSLSGTIAGAKPVTGVSGNGLYFDGVNDSVSVSAVSYFGVSSILSMSFWVTPGSATAGYLVSYPDSANGNRFYLTITNGTTLTFTAATGTGFTIPCATNELAHIVLIRDYVNSTMLVYKNGVLVNQTALTPPSSVGSQTLYFGSFNGASQYACGTFDEIRLYNRVLSLAEVKALYNVPSGYMPGLITGDRIVASSISAINLVAACITSDKYVSSSIVGSTIIQDGTISAVKIMTSSLTATQIAASAITADKFVASSIVGSTVIQDGTITAGKILASSITATQMAADSITAINIAAGAFTAPVTGLIGYWSFDDTPVYPDLIDYPSPATHCFYFQDAWATTDSWTAYAGYGSVAVSVGSLVHTADGTHTYAMERAFTGMGSKNVIIRVRCSLSATISVYEEGTNTIQQTLDVMAGVWATYSFTMQASCTGLYLRYSAIPAAGTLLSIDWIYSGDGTYASSLKDSSGFYNHGTVSGAVAVSGVSGYGLSFDGVNDYVEIPCIKFITTFSWRAIVKANTVAAIQSVISQDKSTDRGPFLYFDATGHLTFTVSVDGTTQVLVATTEVLTDSAFHDVVAVYVAGTSLSLYVDGVLKKTNTTSIPASLNPSATVIRFGRRPVADTYPLSGVLDEVRFYSRALSLTEIKTLYTVPGGYLPGMITGDRIVASSISAINIATSSITAANMAASSIAAVNIVTSSITASQIAASAITTDKFVASSIVGSTIIQDGTITAGKILASSIGATQIAASSISAVNMAASSIAAVNIVASSITATQIAASTITAAKMAASSIAAVNIVSSSITATQIAASTITAAKMAASSIAAVNIVSSAITADKLSVANLAAIVADLGTITAGVLQSTDWSTSAGMQVDLANRTIKSGGSSNPKFSLSAAGVLTAISAILSGSLASGGGISGDHFILNGNGLCLFTGTSYSTPAEHDKLLTLLNDGSIVFFMANGAGAWVYQSDISLTATEVAFNYKGTNNLALQATALNTLGSLYAGDYMSAATYVHAGTYLEAVSCVKTALTATEPTVSGVGMAGRTSGAGWTNLAFKDYTRGWIIPSAFGFTTGWS